MTILGKERFCFEMKVVETGCAEVIACTLEVEVNPSPPTYALTPKTRISFSPSTLYQQIVSIGENYVSIKMMRERFTVPKYPNMLPSNPIHDTSDKTQRITRRESITILQQANLGIQCLTHPRSLYSTHASHGRGP